MNTVAAGARPSQAPAYPIMSRGLVGTGSAYAMDRANVWRHFVQARVEFVVVGTELATEPRGAQRIDVRTPAEHLENIRAVLNPVIGDLSALFEVSRQSIYKWLAGDSMPEAEKLERITALSRIADEFRDAGVTRAGSLLKMKAFRGRSLLDLLRAREDCSEAVQALIAEARTMERSYARSGFAGSKAKPTTDWQSDVSIPSSHEDR
jgi:hypothetical protein